MSTPESTPTHLPWATLCESRLQPVARVDFIPQSGTLDLASEKKVKNQRYKVYRVNSVRFLQQYQQIHDALIYIPVKVYCAHILYSVNLICSRRFRQYLVLFLRLISIVPKYTVLRCLYADNIHVLLQRPNS